MIDLGIIRLNEKVIWKAIEKTNIPYADWTARKEVIDGRPALHLYIELKENYVASEKGLATAVYEEIKKLDDGFIHYDLPSMEKMTDFKPVAVSILNPGSFSNYARLRQSEGADLAQLKPPHINPSDKVLDLLGVQIEKPTEAEPVYQRTSPEAVTR